MKIFIVFVLLLSFVVNSFGAPLVFKTSRDITSIYTDFLDIATFDATKYKNLRIGVKAKRNGTEKRVNLYAVEGNTELYINGLTADSLDYSYVMNTPPQKIKIEAKGEGFYEVFIWAE